MSDDTYAENIIKILAGLPEFLRKPMLKHRLEEFFVMQEDEQKEIIVNALNAIPDIPFDTLAKLIKTWLEVLATFSKDKRDRIFYLYALQISKDKHVIDKMNIDGLIELFKGLDKDMQSIIAESIRYAIARVDDEGFVDKIPSEAKALLRL